MQIKKRETGKKEKKMIKNEDQRFDFKVYIVFCFCCLFAVVVGVDRRLSIVHRYVVFFVVTFVRSLLMK